MELYRSRGEDPSNLGCTLLQRLIGDPEVGEPGQAPVGDGNRVYVRWQTLAIPGRRLTSHHKWKLVVPKQSRIIS